MSVLYGFPTSTTRLYFFTTWHCPWCGLNPLMFIFLCLLCHVAPKIVKAHAFPRNSRQQHNPSQHQQQKWWMNICFLLLLFVYLLCCGQTIYSVLSASRCPSRYLPCFWPLMNNLLALLAHALTHTTPHTTQHNRKGHCHLSLPARPTK